MSRTDLLITQLRHHRLRLGLTQQHVADRMNLVGRGVVCDWESGRRLPRLDNLVAWCDALGLVVTLSLADEGVPSDGDS